MIFDFSRLKDFMDSMPERTKVPGGTGIVYYKGGIVFAHSFGFSDKENGVRMKGGEIFNMYSMTKPITCTAALQLYEKGLFGLCDPLYEYMPEFKHMRYKKVIDGKEEILECSEQIKIVDLFTMTAGFDYNLYNPSFTKVKEETGGKSPTVMMIRALSNEPLSFEPHSHWQYSLGHDVLGALIEVLSGKKFGEYVKENIFIPCDMKDSSFADDISGKLACQYRYDAEKDEAILTNGSCEFRLGSEYESGGAGLCSTAEDYAKFLKTMSAFGKTSSGDIILSKNTINLMRRNFLNETMLKDYGRIERGYGYGLGVRTMVNPVKGGSNGGWEFAWDGAAGSYGLIDPDRDLAFCYIQHMRYSDKSFAMHERLRNVLYSCIYD